MCCLKTNTNSENQLENLFLFYLMLRPDLVPIRYQNILSVRKEGKAHICFPEPSSGSVVVCWCGVVSPAPVGQYFAWSQHTVLIVVLTYYHTITVIILIFTQNTTPSIVCHSNLSHFNRREQKSSNQQLSNDWHFFIGKEIGV